MTETRLRPHTKPAKRPAEQVVSRRRLQPQLAEKETATATETKVAAATAAAATAATEAEATQSLTVHRSVDDDVNDATI